MLIRHVDKIQEKIYYISIVARLIFKLLDTKEELQYNVQGWYKGCSSFIFKITLITLKIYDRMRAWQTKFKKRNLE